MRGMEPIIPVLQSALICDDVRQENNGKFILIGLFDAVMVPEFPAVYPRLFVVTSWCCGQGVFRQRTRLVRPDGLAPLAEGRELSLHLPQTEVTATNVECFLNLDLREAGTHWVEVLLDGDMKIRFPLRVAQVRPPPTAVA